MSRKFVTTKYRLETYMQNGPQDRSLRFVFVSDLHNHLFGRENQELLTAIRTENPDAVLIGGDTLIGIPGASMKIALDFIKAVAKEYPVYYANGNHEHRLRIYPQTYEEMYEEFLEGITASGAIHLVNESAFVEIQGVPVAIHGFEAPAIYYHRYKRTEMPVTQLTNTFGTPDKEHYHILLAHNPAYKDTYLQWGADLTLSGHCHGGVMRLGKHYGLISPNFKLFSGYCHGIFKGADKNRMIVSAGLGEHTIPIRIFNPRELVVIDIRVNYK